MVVYDDEEVLFAFQQVLEKDGHSCVKAKTGSDAIKKFDHEHPEIVFVDMILPDINGLEALRQIKQMDQSIPVIFIGGHRIMQNESVAARKLGAFEFLSKPLSIAKVRETLNKAISRQQSIIAKDILINSPVFSEVKEKVLNKFEKKFISEQLIRHNGNITAAAKASKMSRQNFYRLMIKHNIELEKSK